MPKSEIEKAGTGHRHKCSANATAPLIGINVQCTQLSRARHIRYARWRCGGKSLDYPGFGRNDRLRLKRVEAAEIVLLCSILGANLIEIIIREQRAVGGLPRAHMYARNGNCIVWFRWPK